MEMCFKCGLFERLSYNSYCRDCHNESVRESYKRNPESKERTPQKNKEYRDRYSAKVRGVLRDAKDNKPCVDCGIVYPWFVMDFDHVRGEKKINVGKMITKYGVSSILEEIAKCDLVCSNCHRIRTFNSRGIGF